MVRAETVLISSQRLWEGNALTSFVYIFVVVLHSVRMMDEGDRPPHCEVSLIDWDVLDPLRN